MTDMNHVDFPSMDMTRKITINGVDYKNFLLGQSSRRRVAGRRAAPTRPARCHHVGVAQPAASRNPTIEQPGAPTDRQRRLPSRAASERSSRQPRRSVVLRGDPLS